MNAIEPRNVSLDLLRILACIGVIIIHTAGSFIYHGLVSPGSSEYIMCMIMDALMRWSVPIFVMLSGYFMLRPEKQLPLRKLYGWNILHLVLAQVFWTCFYALILHWRWYPWGGQDNHFWYIGMCIGLYISMPVLRMIAADVKLLSYSCWIWLFIRCYCFVGRFVSVPIVFTDFVFTDYVGYCLWGYYISQVKMKSLHKQIVYALGIVGVLANVIVPLVSSVSITAYETPNVILTSIALFLCVIEHPICLSNVVGKWITQISKLTLGIYMVHMFVLIELFSRMYRYIQQPVVLTVLCVGAVFAISSGIIWTIKKIPYVGKWVV